MSINGFISSILLHLVAITLLLIQLPINQPRYNFLNVEIVKISSNNKQKQSTTEKAQAKKKPSKAEVKKNSSKKNITKRNNTKTKVSSKESKQTKKKPTPIKPKPPLAQEKVNKAKIQKTQMAKKQGVSKKPLSSTKQEQPAKIDSKEPLPKERSKKANTSKPNIKKAPNKPNQKNTKGASKGSAFDLLKGKLDEQIAKTGERELITDGDSAEVSITDINYIRSKIINSWNTTAFSNAYMQSMQVKLLIELDADGKVVSVEVAEKLSEDSTLYDIFIDSTKRAVYEASPFDKLPKGSYKKWQYIEFNFDSSGNIN